MEMSKVEKFKKRQHRFWFPVRKGQSANVYFSASSSNNHDQGALGLDF